MVNLGWVQDTHTQQGNGAHQELVSDYDYLTNSVGVSDIYHGGDVCHSNGEPEPPHVQPSAYDIFFNLIEQTSDPSALKRLIPGNHDVPLSTFLAADGRCVLRDRIDYPADNLTVLLVNTQIPGIVTGSRGFGGANIQGGVGTEVCRVPYQDVQWLDTQIDDAAAQGHAVLVIPHCPLAVLSGTPLEKANGYRGQINAVSMYNVVANHRQIHGMLASHASAGVDIVVPCSHIYQFAAEGSVALDGVHYVYKKHYWNGNQFETFAHIDMDATGATVTTVEHDNRATDTVLDVTF